MLRALNGDRDAEIPVISWVWDLFGEAALLLPPTLFHCFHIPVNIIVDYSIAE
jgi:hypothetical protein